MTLDALWKPVLLYTGVLGPLTVGTLHFATHSGLVVLFVGGGGGLVLVTLSVGTAGPTDGGGFENDEGLDATGGWLGTEPSTQRSLPLLFYGFGVLLWSFVVLVTLYDVLG
ncbi:hypothetical protein [Halolamina rubra]|uniref:hypothetical protein n=1 Tax=Halolamina rubra TaxID=1380430 RepID=UPI00067855BF|nr:hypothetical protein [Halolamina rubra]